MNKETASAISNRIKELNKKPKSLNVVQFYNEVKNEFKGNLYLFNLSIIEKYIDLRNTEELTPVIEKLLDKIFKDIDAELKGILNKDDYKLLNNLFNTKVEANIPNLIRDNKSIKFLSYIYIYVVLKNKLNRNFQKRIFNFERILINHIAAFNYKEDEDYLLDILPKALLNNNLKTTSKEDSYLYFNSYIEKLTKSEEYLNERLDNSFKLNDNLKKKLNELEIEIRDKNDKIIRLETDLNNKIDELKTLEEKLQKTENEFTFESKQSKTKIDNLRASLTLGMKKKLKHELGLIEEFSNGLDENNKIILNGILSNIQDKLN